MSTSPCSERRDKQKNWICSFQIFLPNSALEIRRMHSDVASPTQWVPSSSNVKVGFFLFWQRATYLQTGWPAECVLTWQDFGLLVFIETNRTAEQLINLQNNQANVGASEKRFASFLLRRKITRDFPIAWQTCCFDPPWNFLQQTSVRREYWRKPVPSPVSAFWVTSLEMSENTFKDNSRLCVQLVCLGRRFRKARIYSFQRGNFFLTRESRRQTTERTGEFAFGVARPAVDLPSFIQQEIGLISHLFSWIGFFCHHPLSVACNLDHVCNRF